MRAINYFKNRIEFAMKNNGTIKVNQNDIDALNQLIEFSNTNYKNTQLEDSLILFYILQNWKVENRNNQSIALALNENEDAGIFKISDSMFLLQKLSLLLEPKETIYDQIAMELWSHQGYNKIPKENWIKKSDVKELLEKEIQTAKLNFSFMKDLNKGNMVFIHPETEGND